MNFEDYNNPLKKRNLSTETFYDLNDIQQNNNEHSLTNMLNNLNINNNDDLLKKIIKKIDILEKNFEIIDKLNIKIDKLEKSINNTLIEKDYVIDNLKDNITNLICEIKELKYKNCENIKNENNYFC
jgi:hypothetical protein